MKRRLDVGSLRSERVGSERQTNLETGTLAASVLKTELPAVRPCDQRREIQPQTGTAGVSRTRRIAAVERLADVFQLLVGNPGAVVTYRKHDVGCVGVDLGGMGGAVPGRRVGGRGIPCGVRAGCASFFC